jgi:hypothetical protein
MFDEIKNFEIVSKYCNVITNACKNGHINILEWFNSWI